jgi:DNA-binding GntR family transcriptional regulator
MGRRTFVGNLGAAGAGGKAGFFRHAQVAGAARGNDFATQVGSLLGKPMSLLPPPVPSLANGRTIARVPLRDQVHHQIVERILRDELKAGGRISDTALARELGVSRTPIREALLRLEREGFLEADVGRGFFVRALSASEVLEVYPVLWTLEVLALRTTTHMTDERRALLNGINAELEGEDDPEIRIDLDIQWHRTLLETCGNEYLLGTIEALKQVIRRYEYAYMLNAGFIPVSTRTHELIVTHLAAHDVEPAASLLETNWRFSMESLVEWLHEHE